MPFSRRRSAAAEDRVMSNKNRDIVNDWKEQAELKDDVLVDIGFMVMDSFYYGPENEFSDQQYDELKEPLFTPNLKKSGSFVLSNDICGKEQELLNHYKDVISKYNKHGKDITDSAHFWNRPVIYKDNDFFISFPWHDKFRDGKSFLERLSSTVSGEVFWDCDQGWGLEIHGQGNILYAREWNPDHDETICQAKFDWNSIRDQSKILIHRVTALINYLTKAVGKNYWT